MPNSRLSSTTCSSALKVYACTHDALLDSVSVSLAHSPAPSAANAADKTTARIYNDDARANYACIAKKIYIQFIPIYF